MLRFKKILVSILITVLIMNGFAGNLLTAHASNIYDETARILFTEKVKDIIGAPGETIHIKLPVKAYNVYLQDPRISVDTTDMPFSVDNITYTADGYTGDNPPSGISNLNTTYIEFDLNVKETAKICNKKLIVKVEYSAFNLDTNAFQTYTLNLPNVNFIILSEKEPAQLTVDSVSLEDATIGNNTDLSFTIKNEGELTSYNTTFRVDGYETAGLVPGYSKLKQQAGTKGNLAAGESYRVNLPLTVSSLATPGTKTLSINIEYKDLDGVAYTTETKLYINIGQSALAPKIEIESTKYAGELKTGNEFNLITTLRNVGIAKAEDIQVSVEGLGVNSFIPKFISDTLSVGVLKRDEKTNVKIPLIVSKEATSGLKEITVKITYKDNTNVTYTITSKLYLEVIADDGKATASKPKLIISEFKTDSDELRAGNTFHFIFDIYNTHSKVDAKNIKITVSQTDNIFAVTKGSNTFYITDIPAGQKIQHSLELKVKADATTKTYPLEIKMEYEYDGAEVNPTTGEVGETVTETINLQAVENARPVVENVFVGNYGVPIVNQPTGLTFEFYNLGKSTLNNVSASVEGDYALSMGSMYFIGNVEAGNSEFAELEVIPAIEGLAKGKLIITFEDSNGEKVNITKDFEATVQGEYIPEGNGNGQALPIEEPTKAPIMPTWLFVILQIVILAAGIPVTKKVMIGLYKRKLRKQEDAKLGE